MSTDSVQRFPIVKKGYDPEAVDVYIENLSEKNQFLQGRIMELEKRISLAEDLIESFSKAEDELRQNIADSKKAAASMILDAKQRATALLDDARAECGKIVSQMDRVVANRMQVLNVLKNQATTFKDQLFELYSNHIELIETIANTAQSASFEPDYSGIAEAVNTFEQAGDPETETPVFTEYPENSIFPKVEEIPVQEESPVPTTIPDANAQEKDDAEQGEAFVEKEEEEDDFFASDAENEKNKAVYSFETENAGPVGENTDYYKYLREFANKDEEDNAL